LGVNIRDDVKFVQQLLNRVIPTHQKLTAAGLGKLDVDGSCGALATGTIERFQQLVLGWSGCGVDGTVAPNRTTWKALKGNVDAPSKIKSIRKESSMWVSSYATFRQGDYNQKLGDSTSGTIAVYGCAIGTVTMAATCIGARSQY
jgi:hypothetical protein